MSVSFLNLMLLFFLLLFLTEFGNKYDKEPSNPTMKKQSKTSSKYVPRQASTNIQTKPPLSPPPAPPHPPPNSIWSPWMDGITKAESKDEKDKIDAYINSGLYDPKKHFAVHPPTKLKRLLIFELIAP